MAYQVTDNFISKNRSNQFLSPSGFVIHSTATPGATDENEQSYFNNNNVGASAHYFVDWDSITRCIPEGEVAWHAGYTANHHYLSVEMCEPKDNPVQFQEVWNRTVWLVADACVRYNWNTSDDVFSHRGISAMYHQTDHTDPIDFLASYGKSWDQLLQAIDAEIVNIKNPSQNTNGGLKKVDNLVIHNWPVDGHAAYYLGYALKAPVVQVEALTQQLVDSAVNIYAVGGAESQYVVNGKPVKLAKFLTGNSRFDTARAVLNYIQTLGI